mmetsp:Transcript_21017/g.66022  ORF Transcript_21017/g.66022 Transcript_21017/m.66022 type:complete len:390 (+) Transcript_21017:103-1272(+)
MSVETEGASSSTTAKTMGAASVEQPVGERFMMSGKIEQADHVVLIHGPWRDVTGVVGAQSRYALEPSAPVGYRLGEADLPPDGSYPGRMNFGVGGGAQAKKHQMVDRMALRFRRDGGDAVVEGEGSNRVGQYALRGTCTPNGAAWDLELTRTYTPVARLPRADAEGLSRKRSLDVSSAAELEPRKPRAAAPPKGAWGAQAKKEADATVVKSAPLPKKTPKKDDGRPCLCVVYNRPDQFASVYRCPSLAVAKAKCATLAPETECAIRAASDVGEGVLFPPAEPIPSKLAQPPILPVPQHVVILDVSAPDAKTRPWRASISGFDTARRAATYAIHCYKTCGPRLTSLEWHVFESDHAVEAQPRLSLSGDGAFDTTLPIADYAALDAAAAQP